MTLAIVLFSGGLDSTVLAYQAVEDYDEVILMSFDYGQRHRKELTVASSTARTLGVSHHIVSLKCNGNAPLASILGGSSLTDAEVPVPDGHYAEESMKATVVPNRNAIMISIAYGVAVAERADCVMLAVHAGDHAIYPDCRPEFVDALQTALQVGNAWDTGTSTPRLYTPFGHASKADIVTVGALLRVPFADTWSCYKGDVIHCGTCGTCYERREAFVNANVVDPTKYLDSTTMYAAP